MRRAATVAGLSKDTRKPVDTCADYLQKYAPYLHYDRYLAAGYPIATGVIEGACRYLVRDRMDLTGARWRLAGAEAVLKLRALRASGDFDPYWDFHEARESRPAIRCADSPAGQRAAPAALSTTPSTRQVALAMPLAEAPWAVDEEEPHPPRNRGNLTSNSPKRIRARRRDSGEEPEALPHRQNQANAKCCRRTHRRGFEPEDATAAKRLKPCHTAKTKRMRSVGGELTEQDSSPKTRQRRSA